MNAFSGSMLTAAALWLFPASARAADAHSTETVANLETRLSRPEEFARTIENSGQYPAAVFSPEWNPLEEPHALGENGLSPAGSAWNLPRHRAYVPAPMTSRRPSRNKRPGFPLKAPSKGAGGLLILSLLLLAAGRSSTQEKAPVSIKPHPYSTSPTVEPIASPKPLPRAPLIEPPAKPVFLQTHPEEHPPFVSSWMALSFEEQCAIERWDDSAEKRLGQIPLEQWLDSHEAELDKIDVSLLQAKLRREA